MVAKQRNNMELAASLGVKVGFELHPEEDLHSPLMLRLFRDAMHAVSPSAASAIMSNADASHPTLVGDDAAEHMKYLAEHGLLSMVHLKDGQLRKCYGGSVWGDFAPKWSESRRRFVTFGTGQADWEKIIPIWLEHHEKLEAGLDFIVEAECSQFPDMEQGIEIAIENARRARGGSPFVDKNLIEVKQSANGNWEDFCTSKLSAAELFYLTPREKTEVEEIVEQMGDIGK
jgi:sugar phosphate isomerase/epimerase